MAFGGGTYTKYDKFMPGTYVNTITVGQPQPSATKGTVAVGLVMDWGPDNEIFEINATQFQENAESVTGYSYGDNKNYALRELFSHASRLVAYKLNSDNSKTALNADCGVARCSGSAGNKINVTCYKNANDSSKFDVSTYYDGVLKDNQVINSKSVDQTKITLSTATDGTSIPEELQGVSVDFEVDNNKLIVTYNDLPSGYEVTSRIYLGKVLCAIVPGRLDEIVEDNKLTYVFGPDCAMSDYKIEARVKKVTEVASITPSVLSTILSDSPDDDPDYEEDSPYTTIATSYTTLKTQEFSTELEKNVATGADVTELQDNAFVIFNKQGVIKQSAGYAFTGGSSTSKVNAGAYSNMLNLLESRTFDVLVYDGDDKSIKQLITAFTKRMRDEKGKYFQSVLYNYPDADHEGVISVFNRVTTDGSNPNVTKSSLTLWYAGYSAAIDLNNELTNKRYDGELTIDTSTPDSQLEVLVKQGYVVFHRVSDTEVYTLFDVNTLTSFTDEKDSQMSENKVIRIIDYLHNAESYQLNRNDIGRTPNTEEGRALIWNECYDILSDLQSSGAITNFNPQNLTVNPVDSDRHAVKIDQTFSVTGTIYRIYITTYVVQ